MEMHTMETMNKYHLEAMARYHQNMAFLWDERLAAGKETRRFYLRCFERLAHDNAVKAARFWQEAKAAI
jgi:hypothetical protein